MSKSNAKQRDRWYTENPYCPDCGVHMILPKDIPKDKVGRVRKYPPNMCTYEHIHSRFNPLRGEGSGGPRKNTLLCLKCNNMREAGKWTTKQRVFTAKKYRRT